MKGDDHAQRSHLFAEAPVRLARRTDSRPGRLPLYAARVCLNSARRLDVKRRFEATISTAIKHHGDSDYFDPADRNTVTVAT